ncbi:MAG: type II toxin-antitoxin system death-on-curing family toxin [Hirschia sp.]|nr:type II toxin-antitoxin system death-on-curing family toxin [Hirschia sp.]MBF17576.1 type II toxin-antitoxin system death-on-curing family toxin [Hirschia sp.]
MTTPPEPRWLTEDLLLRVHDRQMADHGGQTGIRDMGLFQSALARPLNAWSYGETDLCILASLYGAGIIKNHPFLDGNKRTGLVAAELFLTINGVKLIAPDAEILAVILALAGGDIDDKIFAEWLREFTP